MASSKSKQTVPIVNPKDSSDPKPWHANVDDVKVRGFTLWADRHAPLRDAPQPDPVQPDPVDPVQPDPVDRGLDDPAATDGSAIDPSAVKKAPGNKKG